METTSLVEALVMFEVGVKSAFFISFKQTIFLGGANHFFKNSFHTTVDLLNLFGFGFKLDLFHYGK